MLKVEVETLIGSIVLTAPAEAKNGDRAFKLEFSGDEQAIAQFKRLGTAKTGFYGHWFEIEEPVTLLDLNHVLITMKRSGEIRDFTMPEFTFKPIPPGAKS